MKLLQPLSAKELNVVDGAMMGSDSNIIVRSIISRGGDSVQRGSMRTLLPGTWLNDKVINYFLKNCLAGHDEKEAKKIQYYDSLGGTDLVRMKGLLEYVKDEYKVKHDGEDMDATEWELVSCKRNIP
ncbi:hypothetical protein ACHAXA_007197 [Cyclostephanos tholiformis]|uniref:Uncharacterized protein n=1 Tax=Cyclostephanos tholiformis TaxID=382380 RepID=A0ABD3SG36_9STRA